MMYLFFAPLFLYTTYRRVREVFLAIRLKDLSKLKAELFLSAIYLIVSIAVAMAIFRFPN